MTTENNHISQTPGSIRVEIEVLRGMVTVGTSPGVSRATVAVHTADTQGTIADAVIGTRFVEYGDTLKVKIPSTDDSEASIAAPHVAAIGPSRATSRVRWSGTGNLRTFGGVRNAVESPFAAPHAAAFGSSTATSRVRWSGTGVRSAVLSQSGLGNVQMDDGTLYINGVAIVRDGVVVVPEGTRVNGLPGTIRVDIQLPPGSEVAFTSSGEASLTLNGDFRRVEAVLADGALSAARADIGTATVSTITGDIALGHTRDSAVLHSDTGDIDVHRFGGGELTATTTTGDIDIRTQSGVNRPATVTLNTVNGDINTNGLTRVPQVRLTANSRTGKTRHRI
ncbi:DUF4097 family beta strand repeat-containing protein [Kitasatospora sp. NPDC003701]